MTSQFYFWLMQNHLNFLTNQNKRYAITLIKSKEEKDTGGQKNFVN